LFLRHFVKSIRVVSKSPNESAQLADSDVEEYERLSHVAKKFAALAHVIAMLTATYVPMEKCMVVEERKGM